MVRCEDVLLADFTNRGASLADHPENLAYPLCQFFLVFAHRWGEEELLHSSALEGRKEQTRTAAECTNLEFCLALRLHLARWPSRAASPFVRGSGP